MKADPSPRERPHRTPGPRGRVSQQRRRSPEPDCPHRSSPPDTRETASSARDRHPQRSASSDPCANRGGIIQRESNNSVSFHTTRVTSGKAQKEQMLSALARKADIASLPRYVRSVPLGDICGAANRNVIRSPSTARLDAPARPRPSNQGLISVSTPPAEIPSPLAWPTRSPRHCSQDLAHARRRGPP